MSCTQAYTRAELCSANQPWSVGQPLAALLQVLQHLVLSLGNLHISRFWHLLSLCAALGALLLGKVAVQVLVQLLCGQRLLLLPAAALPAAAALAAPFASLAPRGPLNHEHLARRPPRRPFLPPGLHSVFIAGLAVLPHEDGPPLQLSVMQSADCLLRVFRIGVLHNAAALGAAIGARHDFGEPTSTDGETHAWRNTQFEGIPDTTRGPSRTTAPPRRRRHARSPSTTLKPAPRSLSLLPDSLHSLHCRGRQPRRGPARASAAKTITQRWSQTCGRLALTRLLQPRACGPSGPAKTHGTPGCQQTLCSQGRQQRGRPPCG
mmetsp:Transcript_23306/g.58847  ORF Transcript_23306/g.58847 Transcript_23306/m.58847 type:complete len:320 (-) Transcript_23306:487-1446(-)